MPIFRRWTEQLKQVGPVAGGTGSWESHSVTVSGGVITVANPGIYAVTGEGGVADEIDTINGGNSWDEIILYAADTDQTITLKHATDNIQIGYDFNLDANYDMARLIKRSDGIWVGGGIGDNA